MNRIDALFESKQKNILSIYFPAGYPTLESTTTVLTELELAGVDMVEVGIPFSDPIADGPIIQNASTQALQNGISLYLLFEQLAGFRSKIKMPVVLMGYLNPIMQYGFDSFCRQCNATGIDGVIIPDLPFGHYVKHYKPVADTYGIRMVMLITPETSAERIKQIDQHTRGFIYMVSSASTTGTQERFDEGTIDYFRRLDNMKLTNPRLVGFGVSNLSTFRSANSYADGVIVGSRFVQELGQKEPREAIQALLASLKV